MRLAQVKVHFIGIGGIGMCGLAEILHNIGGQVTGSDIAENGQTERLRALGIPIQIGQRAENLHGAKVVVYSSAIKNDNVEFREARRLKIPLIPRAEALAELMLLKRGIAVGGSHGKTTTTSMTAAIFLSAGSRPTIFVGGRLHLINSTALLGEGDWLIAEADESDGSFLRLSPEIAIVTNIDNDHLDYYGTVEYLKKAFFDFAMRVPFFGLAIVCGDDPIARETFVDYGKRVLFYGFGLENDLRIEGDRGIYQAYRSGERLGEFRLQVPGRHNALNAAAALAAGLEAGFEFSLCAAGLASFSGADRRMQLKGTPGGVDVYDDYGHHPTEIRAVAQALKEKFPNRRLVTVFQPHRYSRTLLCWDQFLTCFADIDHVYICDIYPAGEAPISNISAERLVLEARARGANCDYLRGDARVEAVRRGLRADDVVVTLGAGDIHKFGPQLIDAIETQGVGS